MFEDNKYESPNVEGYVIDIKNKVISYVESEMGATVDEQRSNLPKLKKYLHSAVDYVMNNLPVGVTRVDGKIIRPILLEVINEKIAALPQPEIEGDII